MHCQHEAYGPARAFGTHIEAEVLCIFLVGWELVDASVVLGDCVKTVVFSSCRPMMSHSGGCHGCRGLACGLETSIGTNATFLELSERQCLPRGSLTMACMSCKHGYQRSIFTPAGLSRMRGHIGSLGQGGVRVPCAAIRGGCTLSATTSSCLAVLCCYQIGKRPLSSALLLLVWVVLWLLCRCLGELCLGGFKRADEQAG